MRARHVAASALLPNTARTNAGLRAEANATECGYLVERNGALDLSSREGVLAACNGQRDQGTHRPHTEHAP